MSEPAPVTIPPIPTPVQTTAPVWAPNPAVPPVARMLAYLFGTLVVLTAILSLAIRRPPDVPSLPDHWAVYQGANGSTVPYPADWSIKIDRHGEETVLFELLPGSTVRIECSLLDLPAPASTELVRQIAEQVEPDMRRRFSRYTPRAGYDAGIATDAEQEFTFRLDQDPDQPMTGVWMVSTHGNTGLLLVALAPEAGWPVMRQIANQIVEYASLK